MPAGSQAAGAVRTSVPLAAATLDGTIERDFKWLPGDLRALEIPHGTNLRFEIPLGREPYLSFRPLLAGDPACPAVYRIKARPPGGEWTVLADRRAESGHWFATEEAVIDLTDFAGRDLELALESAAADCDRGGGLSLWGSPAIYYRGPLLDPGPHPDRPDVILLSFDALRADALGAYGREPSITPALDALAAESDVFLNTFSTFNGTNPSFASIMTGLYGKRHGVYDLRTPLGEDHLTLAEVLSEAGYATGAVVSAHHLRPELSGLGQGFDSFAVAPRLYSAELATDLALDWLAGRRAVEPRRPFFFWLHLFDPHTPHTPPRPYADGLAADGVWGLRPVGSWRQFREPGPVEFRVRHYGAHEALYAGEVAYLDRQVDRLLGFLGSRDMLAHTLLVVTSDHGENLHEHGFPFRHVGLWDTTTRVPLIVRRPGPGQRGHRLPGLAQTLDIFPTVLAAAGLAPPASDGRDLAGWTREASSGRQRVWAEHMNGYGAMVRTERYLYMRSADQWGLGASGGGGYLYDLHQDPAQKVNLRTTRPGMAVELDRQLEEWLADRAEPSAPGPLDEAQREQLRALGYLDD